MKAIIRYWPVAVLTAFVPPSFAADHSAEHWRLRLAIVTDARSSIAPDRATFELTVGSVPDTNARPLSSISCEVEVSEDHSYLVMSDAWAAATPLPPSQEDRAFRFRLPHLRFYRLRPDALHEAVDWETVGQVLEQQTWILTCVAFGHTEPLESFIPTFSSNELVFVPREHDH